MNGVDSTQPVATVNSREFYAEYHGHKVKHLEKILPALRSTSDSIIWLAGDSSLDNKYWFHTCQDAVPGAYAQVLRPPVSKCDINYWLNYLALQRSTNTEQQNTAGNSPSRRRFAAMNTAVEATTLNQRVFHLTQQDGFIRDKITKEDILIVSIGGNDIALLPSPCTIAAMMGLVLCTPPSCLEGGFTCCSIPQDDCCCGCGPSFLSCAGGCPPCLSYFRHMFGTRVESYIKKLTRKTKPELILVCMIYYPDEAIVPSSWANPALSALGYNNNPKKLQLIIRKVFEEATSRIHVSGTVVIPVPLYHILDGKSTADYVARVEPSPTGGRKLAEYLLDIIEDPHKHSRIFHSAPSSMSIVRN